MIVQGRSIPPVSSFGWKCWRCFLRERRALRHAPEFQHHRSLHAAKALRNGRTALQRAFRGSREGQSLLHNVSSLNYQTREFALSAYHRVENQSIPSSLSPDLVNYENLSNSDQFESGYGIRQHLVEWQKQHGQQNIDIPLPFDSQGDAASTNDSMRLRGHNENRVSDDSDLPEREDPVPFEVDEETTGRQYEYLNPGDLVELPTGGNREATVGVFIREFNVYSQLLSLSGAWVHIPTRAIPFSVPNFVDPAMLDDIIPYLPQDEMATGFREQSHLTDVSAPREVSSPVITRLRKVWKELEAIYRANSAVLDNAHQVLAHQTDLRFGTLDKIATKLLGSNTPLTPPALLAVRRALRRKPLLFGADRRSVRFTRVFLIHPRQLVQSLHEVAGWVRDYKDAEAKAVSQGESINATWDTDDYSVGVQKIQRFLIKARNLIQKRRPFRDVAPDGAVGPSREQRPLEAGGRSESMRILRGTHFGDSDRAIIKFLFTACLTKMFSKEQRYVALAEQLVRATGEYEFTQTLTQAHIYTFLIELGAILPYENPYLHDENLLLPNSQRSKPLERLRDTINRDDPTATFPDSMKALRRDWKGLPVYCIDSAATENVDDGISVEKVPGSSEEFWVHVHVANPTARIDKDSDIARMAAHMTSTLYSPDEHYWLLPHWISQRFVSLAPNRPVLTFSARIDKDGNILQTQIQSGIVRNVIRVTYSGLDNLFDIKRNAAPRNVLSVGLSPEVIEGLLKPETPSKLTADQRKDFDILLRLAKARRAHRNENGGLTFSLGRPQINAFSTLGKDATNLAAKIPFLSDVSYSIDGDPAISLMAEEFSGYVKLHPPVDAQSLVVEMMLLAGEIGGQWCSERNIPIVYRGMFESILRKKGGGVTADTFWNEVMEPRFQKDGSVPDYLANTYTNFSGKVGSSLVPLRHTSIGLSQYAKVTTPLGRYSDMIAHWQIESALREEARTGRSLKGSNREDYLAFTRAELAPVVPRLRARESMLNSTKLYSSRFWAAQLFFRALHHQQAELPETVEVVVGSESGLQGDGIAVHIKQYGIQAFMEIKPERLADKTVDEPFARLGDHWEAKLTRVLPYRSYIYVQPVRLLHREEDSLDEIINRLRRNS